jgi:hypothetical protein
VAGDTHPSVAELASLYEEVNAFYLDALLERVTDELDLREALARGLSSLGSTPCHMIFAEDDTP